MGDTTVYVYCMGQQAPLRLYTPTGSYYILDDSWRGTREERIRMIDDVRLFDYVDSLGAAK